jgi:ketosteroid isomerase-like protein
MSEKNKKIVISAINKIKEKDYSSFSGYLAENVKWNIVGMPLINGKNEFIKAVETLQLDNFESFNIRNIISDREFVVIVSGNNDSKTKDKCDRTSYCDIYKVYDGKICELTTYMVDTTSEINN